MQEITQSRLKEVLSYNSDTGIFVWLVSKARCIKVGDIAGFVRTSRGKRYVDIRIDGTQYQSHRLAFLYMEGKFPPNHVDHTDGDGLNNKWNNLNHATQKENGRNQRLSSRNTSGYVGVCWQKQRCKWLVHITINGKVKNLGRFTDMREAIAARQAANIKYGFHINHGQTRPL